MTGAVVSGTAATWGTPASTPTTETAARASPSRAANQTRSARPRSTTTVESGLTVTGTVRRSSVAISTSRVEPWAPRREEQTLRHGVEGRQGRARDAADRRGRRQPGEVAHLVCGRGAALRPGRGGDGPVELSRRPYAPGARVRASAVAPGGTRTARRLGRLARAPVGQHGHLDERLPTVEVDEAQGGRRRDIETRHHLRGRGCRCRRGVVDAARRRAVDPLVGQDGRDDTTRRDDVHRRGRLVGRQGVERDDDALSAGWRGCAPRRRDGAPRPKTSKATVDVGAGVAHDEALGARGAGAASDEPGVGCRKAAGVTTRPRSSSPVCLQTWVASKPGASAPVARATTGAVEVTGAATSPSIVAPWP